MAISRMPVVGYVRVSSEGQADNTSLPEQEERIRAYCLSQGWHLVKVFREEGRSGSNTDRPAYQEMLKYVTEAANGIKAVLVYKTDRLSRRLKDILILIEDTLQPAGVSLKSITEPFDTLDPVGKLMVTFLGGFAEFERNAINGRTKGGRIRTAKQGGYAGGEPPYGYRAVGKGLAIDEGQAETVRRIFSLYLKGLSTERIATLLNDEGIAAKTAGKRWTKQTVAYMLGNPVYAGIVRYNGKREENGIEVKGMHPAIVSVREFNKVQRLKASRVKKAS